MFPKKDKRRLFKRCLAFTFSLAVTLPTVATGNISYDNSGSVYAATEDVVYGDVNSDKAVSRYMIKPDKNSDYRMQIY